MVLILSLRKQAVILVTVSYIPFLLSIFLIILSFFGNGPNIIVFSWRKKNDNKIKFSVKEISSGYYFIIVANDKSKYKKALKFLKK